MTSEPSVPSARALALIPALITLAVTILRLILEFAGAPAWLASSSGGGGGAIIGIVWLPLVFGPWFALALRPHLSGKAFWLRLWKTLTVYGLLARMPVFLITIPAVLGNWGTHYDKFPGSMGPAAKIGAAFVAQMGFWACVWTPAVGLVAGLVTVALRGRAQPARA